MRATYLRDSLRHSKPLLLVGLIEESLKSYNLGFLLKPNALHGSKLIQLFFIFKEHLLFDVFEMAEVTLRLTLLDKAHSLLYLKKYY